LTQKIEDKSLPKITNPVNKALQGIAHWVSYSKMYYNNHKIHEGAISHEFCKLLQSNLANGEKVLQEIMLKDFAPVNSTTQERVDLLVKKRNEETSEDVVTFVVELKRDVSKAQIDKDIEKLLRIKQSRPDISCCLIIVSERNRIKRFIDDEGVAIRKTFHIKNNEGGSYKVRRVCKSSASFNPHKKEVANYAVLIEVFI